MNINPFSLIKPLFWGGLLLVFIGANIIGIYLLEHPNSLNIPSSQQMGLYRGLLSYNDFIHENMAPYLKIIGVVLASLLVLIFLMRHSGFNYLIVLCFTLFYLSLWLMDYHNPYIYFVVISVELVIYTGYRFIRFI